MAKVTRDMLTDAEVDEFPVVDLADFLAGKPCADPAAAEQIKYALENIGFLVLVNHGISRNIVDGAFAAAEQFHALPLAEKMKTEMGSNFVGYLPSKAFSIKTSKVNDNTRPDINEAFFVDRDRTPDDPEILAKVLFREPNKWPDGVPGFREAVMRYYGATEGLAKSLIPLFERVFDLPAGFLAEAFREPQGVVRLSHYPPVSYDDNEFGIAPHTDSNFLTFLPQSKVEGLYVHPIGRGWLKAPSIPDAIVVNSGDLLRRWTNDRFLSTEHLAINPTPDRHRYAIPYFFAPNTRYPIRTLPSCVSDQMPSRYPDTTYEQIRLWFVGTNYHKAKVEELAEP